VVGLGRVVALAAAAFGVGLVLFALSRTLWLSLVELTIVGAGMMITMAATNTIVQTLVHEQLRGRVMAFYTMAFLGTAPIGSLLAGIAAERFGSDVTVLGGGVACLLAAGWFALRLPHLRTIVRPIYVERGILAAAEIEAGRKAL